MSLSENRISVLCVDDEPQVLSALHRMLRKKFQVFTAESAEEGLELLRNEGSVHVIISDMRMPEMNGAEFLALTREISPLSARVVLTGYSDMDSAISAVNDGNISKFLTKPCGASELCEVINDLGNRHLDAIRQLRLQKEMEAMQDEVVKADKLALVGAVAGSVGHELNNLATVFSHVMSETSQRADEGLPPEQSDLQYLHRVFEHIRNHASQLMKLGRPDEAPTETLDLSKTVRDVVSMLDVVGVTKSLDVQLDLPADPVQVEASRARLEQILLNLIKNAADATRGIGRRGRLWVSVVSDGRGAVCSVRDNGCGVPDSVRAKIFEPYFTTKSDSGGTGLGLPVVRQILESYGGSIDATSEDGDGTTFEFVLPCKAVAA